MGFNALDRGRQRLARLLEGRFDSGAKEEPAKPLPRRKPWESDAPGPGGSATETGGAQGAAKPWEREAAKAPVVETREAPPRDTPAASRPPRGDEATRVVRSDPVAADRTAAGTPAEGRGRGEARPEMVVRREREASAALALRDTVEDLPTTPQMAELRGGDVVGSCEIEGLIGRSRCYSVYRARHREWSTRVAIKVPRSDCSGAAELMKTFAAAAETWIGLGLHPNVASCYYTQVVDGVPFAVLEGGFGGNLQAWITSGRSRNPRVGLSLGLQICHGLEWAHEAHVWHGALKPENLLVGEEGDVAIADFGVAARAVVGAKEGKDRGEFYVAPECWVDPANLDARADIFSLGVCLYELLLGIRPYEMTRGPRRSAAVPSPGILPEPLAALLRSCVEWEPAKRPQSVFAVRKELAAAYQLIFSKESPFAEPPRGSWEADGWNNRALAAQLLGRPEDAEVAWENALAADAKHLAATYNYGVARWRGGRLPDVAVLRQLEQSSGRASELAPLIAAVHCERGDLAAAQRALPAASREGLPAALQDLLPDDGEVLQAGPRREWSGYSSYLTSVSLSADGAVACFGTDEGGLFSARADAVESARELNGHDSSIAAVALAASGRCAVSAGDDGVVRVWDLATRRCVSEIPASGKVMSAAFSEEKSLLVMACSDSENFVGVDGSQIVVWEVERQRALVQLKGHTNTCKAVAISRNGHIVVSGSDDLSVRVWDLEHGGQCRRVLEGNQHFIAAVAVSDDGNTVVSAGWDKSVRVWNLATGATKELWGHLGIVNAVAVSGDGRVIISGGWDRTVRIWDAESGRCLRTIEAHAGIVSSVSVSVDGRIAASAGWDNAARVWTVPQRWENVCAPLLVRRRIYAPMPTGEPEPDELCEKGEQALRNGEVAEALDLVRRARAGSDVPTVAADLWRALGRLCRRTEVIDLRPLSAAHLPAASGCAAFVNGGRWLVSGGLDGSLLVWNVGLERRERKFEGHEGRVSCLASSDDGATLVSGGVDRTVRLWEADTGRCARVLRGHSSIVSAVVASADGRWILSAGYDHELRLWDTAAAKCAAVFAGHRRQVSAVAIDVARGRYAGGDFAGVIRVGDLRDPAGANELRGHESRVVALRFGDDGRRLLSADAAGTLRLWDVETSECLRELEGQPGLPVWLDFRDASDWAATLAADGHVVFWNTASGKAVATAALADRPVATAALSADGDTLLVLGTDGAASFWELEWDLAAPLSAVAQP